MNTQHQNTTGSKGSNLPQRVMLGPDSLSFTGMGADGFFSWWNVTPPQSESWEEHVGRGEQLAAEFVGFMRSEDRDPDYSSDLLAHIDLAMQQCGRAVSQGVRFGFFSEISRALARV